MMSHESEHLSLIRNLMDFSFTIVDRAFLPVRFRSAVERFKKLKRNRRSRRTDRRRNFRPNARRRHAVRVAKNSPYLSISCLPPIFVTAAIYFMIIFEASVLPLPDSPLITTHESWPRCFIHRWAWSAIANIWAGFSNNSRSATSK